MNYGRTDFNQQRSDSDRLFEQGLNEGAGVEDTNVNDTEPENNLDTTNLEAHWGTSTDDQTLQQNLGNNVINIATNTEATSYGTSENIAGNAPENSTESIPENTTEIAPSNTQENASENTQTVLVMPPGMDDLSATETLKVPSDLTPKSHEHIRISDHLNEAGIKAAEHAISDFQQTGDASGLVERINDMRDEAIKSLEERGGTK